MLPFVRRPWIEAALVALPMVVLYQWLAWRHVEAQIGLFNDQYFGADPHLYTAIFTEITAGPRRWMHPLLPIVVGLPGRGLVALGLPAAPVACALMHLAGFLCLIVFQLVLRRAGCGFLLRALGAWLLGVSFSSLMHTALPESFVFGALALLGTVYWLQNAPRPGLVGALLAAACFGTTVTNLLAWAGMVLVARWLDWRGSVGSGVPFGRAWRRFVGEEVGRWALCGAAGLALAVAAFALYETAFAGWGHMLVQPQYETVHWNWPADPLARLRDLGAVIGTPPVLLQPMTFAAPVALEPVAAFGKGGTALLCVVDRAVSSYWPAILAYAALAAACLRRIAGDGAVRRLALLLLANLCCQLPVYFLYGDALHAYSMHWTFALCGGIVIVLRRCGGWGTLGLALLVAGVGVGNMHCALDVADAHLAYRDHAFVLRRTAGATADGGVAFTLHGRVGLERGTARPFLLWPDERTTAPDAATNQFMLPMFVLPTEQWRWLGDGRGDGGEITGQGVLPARYTSAPAWISLRLEGWWRDFRVEGFLFPQKLGP